MGFFTRILMCVCDSVTCNSSVYMCEIVGCVYWENLRKYKYAYDSKPTPIKMIINFMTACVADRSGLYECSNGRIITFIVMLSRF